MAPLPDVSLSYGPMLIGVFINLILYGVFLGQALTYYQRYRRDDDAWLQYFVAYLFVLETLNTGFDMEMMYQPLILQYGHVLDYFPTVFVSEPLCVVLVSTPTQLFFAWRIWTLTRVRWAPILIVLLAGAAFGGGLWTATKLALIKQFARKPELHAPALLWFSASSAADVGITVGLVWTLAHRKTGFVATDGVIDKIIRTTIQTGLVTSIFSVLDIIFFMVFPHLALNFVWDLPLSKLYSNALLSTLNARAVFGSMSGSRARFGSGPHSAPRGSHTETHTGRLVFEDMALVTTDGQTQTELATKFEEFDDLDRDEQVRALDVRELGGVRGEAESEITETARSSGTGTASGSGTMRSTGTMYSGASAATRGLES